MELKLQVRNTQFVVLNYILQVLSEAPGMVLS